MKKISKITLGMILVFALGLLCFSSNIRAEDVTGNVTIENSPPTIASVILLDPAGNDVAINLEAGSNVTVTATATISDANGGDSILNASAILYHESSTSDSADDENTHITNSSCTLGTTTDDTDRPVTCSFTMGYMALPGTWTVNITAVDDNGSQVSGTDDNTVVELAGLEVIESHINFGSLQLGANSSTGSNMTIRSQGNVQINAQYSGTDYACTVGTIPVVNTRYGLIDTEYNSLTTDLTTGAVEQTGFDLGVRGVAADDGINSEKNEYWGIQIPTSGVSGTCLNTITVTAIAET
jgi:hypothetical protein